MKKIAFAGTDGRTDTGSDTPTNISADGTSTLESGPIMGGIMHLMGEVDPQDVKIGMRVQAVWKAPEEREGAITDILYFKPLEEV